MIKKIIRPKILAHWCYDLFPEAILADGMSGPICTLASAMKEIARLAYHSVGIMVDIGQCMRKRLDKYEHSARRETLTPWALVEPQNIESADPGNKI